MSNFSPAESSIYLENKSFCDNLVDEFDVLKLNYSGYCDSYGYKVTTNINVDGLHFFLEFEKNQSTQGQGLFWYPRSINLISTLFKVTGLKKQKTFSFGDIWIIRLFRKKNNLIKSDSSEVYSYIIENNIERLVLKNGRLTIRTYDFQKMPSVVIDKLKPLLQILR